MYTLATAVSKPRSVGVYRFTVILDGDNVTTKLHVARVKRGIIVPVITVPDPIRETRTNACPIRGYSSGTGIPADP